MCIQLKNTVEVCSLIFFKSLPSGQTWSHSSSVPSELQNVRFPCFLSIVKASVKMKMCVYSDIYTEGLGAPAAGASTTRPAHFLPLAYCASHTGRRGLPLPWLGKAYYNFSLYVQFCKYNCERFIHTTTTQTIKDVFGNQNYSIIAFLKRSIFFTLGAELCFTTWWILPEGTEKS